MIFLSGYGMVGNSEILECQRRMAIAFGGDLVWGTPLFPGRTLSQAEAFQIPAIYTETTGTGGLRRADLVQYKEGVRNVLRCVGMMEGAFPNRPIASSGKPQAVWTKRASFSSTIRLLAKACFFPPWTFGMK